MNKTFRQHGMAGAGRIAALMGCTALALLAPVAARAQEEDEGKPIVLEPVQLRAGDSDSSSVVAFGTAAGSKMAADLLDTPASVSIITAREIRQRGAETVEQVLGYTPGVATDFYGSDDRFDYIKIRGFDAYAYRDGLSLGRPFGASREEAFAFERVEVVKGANSTAFGISDPGGSINYVTKRPRMARFGEIYGTAGAFGHKEVGFDFGDNLTGDATLSYRLTGKLKDAGAEYDHSRDDETFLMAGLTWRPSEATSLTVVADWLKRDGVPGGGGHPVGIDLDRSVFLGEPDYNFRGVDRKTLSVMLEHDFGGGLTFGSNLRYSNGTSDFGYAYVYDFTVDPTVSTVVDRYFFGNESKARQFIADARLQYDTTLGTVASRTLGGVEYWKTDTTSHSYYTAAPGIDWTNPVYTGAPVGLAPYASSRSEQSGKAAYVQQELTFANRWILTAGLRHDWMDLATTNLLTGARATGKSSETTKRLALTWKATPGLSVYGSYAESVGPATTTVVPERGEQLELGVKYRPDSFRGLFSAAIYDLTKNNITRTNPATNQPETIGEVRVRGLDLEAKAEVTRALSLTAGYSWMKSKILENGTAGNIGKEMTFVPRHVGSLWVNYALPASDRHGAMGFGLGARFNGAYYYDAANTTKNKSYLTVDASFDYAFADNLSLAVNVSNLFDRKAAAYGGYGADGFNPGRKITATLRRTW